MSKFRLWSSWGEGCLEFFGSVGKSESYIVNVSFGFRMFGGGLCFFLGSESVFG